MTVAPAAPATLLTVTQDIRTASIKTSRGGTGPFPGAAEVGGVSAVLALEDVSRAFGGVAAVRGVSTVLQPAELRGLIGPNGSGKTTLLNLIGGQLAPDRGRVLLDGRPIQGRPPEAAAALGIARTFQLPRIFRHMTVLDNLLVPLCADHRAAGWGGGVRDARETLALVGLEALAAAEARVLSGGQAMLLQLVRCLAQRPLRVCLLDEPFAGVHPAIKERMMTTIRRINAEGVAFLIVSHEMATLRQLCPRIGVMHEGRWIAEGDIEAVAADPRVIEAYLGGGSPGAAVAKA